MSYLISSLSYLKVSSELAEYITTIVYREVNEDTRQVLAVELTRLGTPLKRKILRFRYCNFRILALERRLLSLRPVLLRILCRRTKKEVQKRR